LLLLPLARSNSIVIAAPGTRIDDIKKEIEKLDVPVSGAGTAVPIQLKRAAAATVAAQIQNYWNTRYPGDANQIRITYDANTNTLFVQAAPSDFDQIREMIQFIDNNWSSAINELRVIPLRN